MRRKASKILFFIFLLLYCFSSCRSQTNQRPFTLICPPYLQNISNSGITIMWMVSRNATSWVEYGKTQQPGSRAIHSESGMIDVNPGVQKVILTGLEPGTHYFYRVASKDIKLHQAYNVIYGDTLFSDLYSFTMPSFTTENFSFLSFNDIHSKPEFINQVVSREKEFNFVMLCGDILGDINSEDDISKYMLIPLSNYFATNKPFFLARGNHETRGMAARRLGKYIDSPNGKYYYSFTYGNACFIVLDCGEDKPDENREYFGLADYDNYRMDEAEWLALEVKRPEFKNAKYKIVCSHMPLTLEPSAENTSGHGMRDCSEKFAPILSNAGVDLLLCGHTHQFSIIKPQKGLTSFPIIIGGAPVNGNDLEKTTYTLVEVDKSGIHCSLKKANGNIIEELTIAK
jgi:predicted phosphodiesterase